MVLDARVVGPFLLVKDLLLGGLQHGVEAPEDGHGEDDVAVLAPHVDVAEQVIGYSPDEVGYLAELGVLQGLFSWIASPTGCSLVGWSVPARGTAALVV